MFNKISFKIGTESNFNKYTTNQVDYLNLPYDYGSIMHYGPTSFSSNGLPTIQVLQAGATIGQRNKLSDIDIAEIRTYYGCV